MIVYKLIKPTFIDWFYINRIWDVESGLCVVTMSDLSVSTAKFRFVADNKYLVGFSRSEWTDGIKVWDLEAIIASSSRSGHNQTALDERSCALWTLPIATDRKWTNIVVEEYQLYAFGRYVFKDEHHGVSTASVHY